ncbi:MAG: hypothetical protein RJA90_1709, partial [Bacteroidota bacterium]
CYIMSMRNAEGENKVIKSQAPDKTSFLSKPIVHILLNNNLKNLKRQSIDNFQHQVLLVVQQRVIH